MIIPSHNLSIWSLIWSLVSFYSLIVYRARVCPRRRRWACETWSRGRPYCAPPTSSYRTIFSVVWMRVLIGRSGKGLRKRRFILQYIYFKMIFVSSVYTLFKFVPHIKIICKYYLKNTSCCEAWEMRSTRCGRDGRTRWLGRRTWPQSSLHPLRLC